MSRETITVISGIPPDASGTGMMMRQLMKAGAESMQDVRFIYRARPAKPIARMYQRNEWWDLVRIGVPHLLRQVAFHARLRAFLWRRRGKALLVHPQTLGFALTVRLLRALEPRMAYIYVLDSSYFCVRSYNHIRGEGASCLRCLGGHFESREHMACRPWPVPDPHASSYTDLVFELGQRGDILFLSQNHTQAGLIRRHLGPAAKIDIVGLWGGGWTEIFDALEHEDEPTVPDSPTEQLPTFLIHSFYVEAKGAAWFIELARRLPEFRFACPFPKATAIKDPPPNVTFKAMTWETGLREAMTGAYMVMVPSMWSAPVEGALVKSLATARRVATVENDSHFQTELPEELVLRLSSEPDKAAAKLRSAVASDWRPDSAVKQAWLSEFRAFNEVFARRILKQMSTNEYSAP